MVSTIQHIMEHWRKSLHKTKSLSWNDREWTQYVTSANMLKKANWKTHVNLSMPCEIESLDGHFTLSSITTESDETSRQYNQITIPHILMTTHFTF